ncbi:MAG: TetR/AcrR family transcriptional regulator [Methanoregulaceae archaeon]
MPKVVPEYREAARKRIIAAGWDVMCRKGYCATTMDEIAAEVGVTKSALYLYFKNKDALVAEIVQLIPALVRQRARESFPDATPLQGWTSMLEAQLAADTGQDSLILELVAMAARNSAVGGSLAENIRAGYEMAAHGIAAQQREGLVRDDTDPHTLALGLAALFFGFQCLTQAGIDHAEIRERWLVLGRILLEPAGRPAPCAEGCPWTDEMGRRLAAQEAGESIELPDCPETCDVMDCPIRRYRKA